MAFPVVAGTATTNGTTATATPAVNLPANIKSGDLLVVLFRVAVAGAIGWPAGWTELFDLSSDAADDQMALAWRKADGTEGTTVALTCTSGKFAALASRITGAADPTGTPPQLSTVATGTSTTPDPTTCTPTGGAKDYLWLWLGGWENEQTSPPASQPTNFSSPIGADSGVAGAVTTNCRVASARRSFNAASLDAGSWTISVSDDWTAYLMAVHPAPKVRITAQSATAVTRGTNPTITWETDTAATAYSVRAESTTATNGIEVASGGAVSAATPTVTPINSAAMIPNHTSDLRVWATIGGAAYRNLERRPWGVIMDNSNDWTPANFATCRTNGCDIVVLAAFWDRMQTAALGSITGDADWTTLTTAVANAATAGLKVQLDISVQYPPAFATTDIAKFKNQSAQEWSTAIAGKNVRDWVFTQLGRDYVGDFINQVVANIDKTKLFSIRLGGLSFNELIYPDARDEAAFTNPSYWGHGAAAQTGTGLAAGMSPCPLPGYVLFVGGGGFSQSAENDAIWTDWYLDSMAKFMLWQIGVIRAAGWTGRIHVMHPGFGIRSNWPTSDAAYRVELMLGTDTKRMIDQYKLLDDIHPYSTWLEDDDRATPVTVDSEKASWRKISDEAAVFGRHHSMLGENAGAGANAAEMDVVVNGALGPMIDGEYRASMWLHFSALQGLVGGSAVWADYIAEIAQNQEGDLLADGIERYLLVLMPPPHRSPMVQLLAH